MSIDTGRGFNLVMQLEDKSRLLDLMVKLGQRQPDVRRALAALGYVHFARFLPLWSQGMLLVVTEFDGDMKDYALDFAVVLDTEFSLILSYMKGRPSLPVSRYPQEFWAYIERNTRPDVEHMPPYAEPFSAYPGLSVLDITGSATKVMPPRPADVGRPPTAADLADVQPNVLYGYRAERAIHRLVEFKSAQEGRALLSALDGLVFQGGFDQTPAPATCVTLGLTHAGLQALDLPQEMLSRFPVAFREGPRLRATALGDIDKGAPHEWALAGFDEQTQQPVVVHAIVSLLGRSGGAGKSFDEVDTKLASLLDRHALPRGTQSAQALDGAGQVHFGYRDGISQPRFQGVPDPKGAAPRTGGARAPVGDLLLGADYADSRGGRPIGALPPALAANGTYAALRVIAQDVAAFERLLAEVKQKYGVEPALTAAKLMGRWRDGAPLSLVSEQAPGTTPLPEDQLDAFDYVGAGAALDDREGRRCPMGAHIRRFNPRSGSVVGVPWGRSVVRRGLPYGPAFDASKPTADERGLVGLFLCADLQEQFEFLQKVWANGDLSAPGLRQTQEPFVGARREATPFRFRAHDHGPEITIMVPPLTHTRGSAYFFMPGRAGLAWLARQGWQALAV